MGRLDPVEMIVRESAFRWEVVISCVRAIFCAVVLGRLLTTGPLLVGRVLLEAPLLVGIIVFSVLAALRARSGRATEKLLLASVTIDAVGCFFALLANVLDPWPGYDGILRIPDSATLLVVVMAAGFRLSPSAAWLGCALHAVSASVLIAIDVTRNEELLGYRRPNVVFFAILVGSAMLLALVIATRVRRLVRAGAMQQLAAERAKMNLWHVLEGNHEMRSALSAVALETELFLRAVQGKGARGEDPRVDQEEVVRTAADLRAELTRLNALVAGIREHTYAELAAMQGAMRVDVAEIAEIVVARVRARFPELVIERTGASDARVVIAGGRTSLDRVLSNLLVNACEGDGREKPRHVHLDVQPRDGSRVAIRVCDDGPGFSPEVLAASLDARGPTTKADGSGLGLFLVHTIVSATGGSLDRKTRSTGGAEVIVELPGAYD
ncbi:MAG: hypothetical protein BGO98_42630 [Myxococcales bacterium 68-20]|nr:MAG: hypothetical protein BGO98_42630 [Myxococcales bacterium 68-20]